ncbi:tripartite tricarboxylate transporter TctB family protein [Tropicimonas sp. S265A]|uniref:tripartite tricarboxylate transporter TctB family protein n=1 Tax=Tropicimonas sp. S265A TaxID=3415134 RepID=UPI003C7DB664
MSRIANEQVMVLLGLLLIGVGLYASTFGQVFSSTDLAQSPVFFPRIILVLWIGLSLLALVQALWSPSGNPTVANWWRVLVLLLASVVYTNVIGREGFFLPSVVFAAISLPIFGIRNPVTVAFYAIAVPGALVLFFNHMLKMPLPVSRFTHLF